MALVRLLENAGPRQPCVRRGGEEKNVALLRSTAMPQSKTRHLQQGSGATWSNLRGDLGKWDRMVNRTSEDCVESIQNRRSASFEALGALNFCVTLVSEPLFYIFMSVWFCRKQNCDVEQKLFRGKQENVEVCHRRTHWKGPRTCNFLKLK